MLLTATAQMPTLLLTLLVIPVAFAGSLTVPALTVLLMASVPAQRAGTAAGILNTARQVGAALAVALFGVLVSHGRSFQSGLRISLVLGAVVLLSTTVATLTLLRNTPEQPPSARRRRRRSAGPGPARDASVPVVDLDVARVRGTFPGFDQ